jgi:hypothetical protein
MISSTYFIIALGILKVQHISSLFFLLGQSHNQTVAALHFKNGSLLGVAKNLA